MTENMKHRLGLNSNIEQALEYLGYTIEWLELGVVSEQFLLSQYEDIKNSEDQNAEHYRANAFNGYLKHQQRLTIKEIDSIFSLRDNGADKCNLHKDRIIKLLDASILDDEQFAYISKYITELADPIAKRYAREKLIRKIDRDGIPASLQYIMNTDDSAIHEYLINNVNLEYDLIIWLQEHGLNKRVRNIAKQMVKSRKKRSV